MTPSPGAGTRQGPQPRCVRTAYGRALSQRPERAELHRAGRRRQAGFAQLVEGTSTRPTGGRCGCSSPASSRKPSCASVPTAGPTASRAACPRPTSAMWRPGRSIPRPALALARTRAHDEWNVDFDPYHLLEQSQDTQTTGRVDHHFVFERNERFAGAGIRLQVIVSGDEFDCPSRPTCTCRRSSIAASRSCAVRTTRSRTSRPWPQIALYGLGGCVIAVLWLLRERWLLWRPALVAGGVVGGLMALAVLAGRTRGVVHIRYGGNRGAHSGCSRPAPRCWRSSAARCPAASCSWRRKAFRGARFRTIRSSGA